MPCQQAPASCVSVSPFLSGPAKSSGIKYFSSRLLQARLRQCSLFPREALGQA